ncbi:hypothetical protein BJX64DRAFT_254992 [Aspergillus heterothallicus]
MKVWQAHVHGSLPNKLPDLSHIAYFLLKIFKNIHFHFNPRMWPQVLVSSLDHLFRPYFSASNFQICSERLPIYRILPIAIASSLLPALTLITALLNV